MGYFKGSATSPLSQEGGAQAQPNLGRSLLFMNTPLTYGGLVFRGSDLTAHFGWGADSAPQPKWAVKSVPVAWAWQGRCGLLLRKVWFVGV